MEWWVVCVGIVGLDENWGFVRSLFWGGLGKWRVGQWGVFVCLRGSREFAES